jgi:hypothetical protein
MSDRAGLTFSADVDDAKAKMKLVELLKLGDNVNAQLMAVDAKALETQQQAMTQMHDILLLSMQMSEMMGIQWTATQKLAMAMIEQAFLAGSKALQLISTGTPWMVPWVLVAYGTMMTMQVMAYQELQEKGDAAQAEWFQQQQMMQLTLRFL